MALFDRVLTSLRRRLQIPDPKVIDKTRAAVRDVLHRVEGEAAQTQATLKHVSARIAQLSGKMDRFDRALADERALIQRVERLLEERNGKKRIATSVVPAPWPVIDEEWWILDRCPVCEHAESHCVSEFNRFLVNDRAPEAGFEVYNYTLCHQCGVVFAARRPRGQRFRALVEGFTENLGRMPGNNPVLNPRPLTAEDRAALDQRVAAGVLVSEDAGLDRRAWIPGVQADRFANAVHVEILGSLLTLQKARVLEVRSRTGAILAALRRLYDAEVMALSIFESQQYLTKAIYDIPADGLIDFEHFNIPYEGQFDLVISNHMLTHAVTPRHFLATVHARLQPGGHLYLYNEPDDAEFLVEGSSMFRVLNPFHLQTFDRPALVRMLRANGFEPVYVQHTGINFLCLAKRVEQRDFAPMPLEERAARAAAYERARDDAILRLPPELQQRFGDELPEVTRRAVVAGTADFDDKGRLLLGRKLAHSRSASQAFH